MSGRSHPTVSENPADHDQLAAAVTALVDEFKPEAIYLFGSHIEGTARPESSYDVLVVCEDVASIRLLERIKRAIKATEDILLNITPLVYTPDEVKLLEQQGEGFMASVLENSKVLYDKSDKPKK